MQAMILCAGAGKRMQPLTHMLPKPLVCVDGRPMVVHHIVKFRRAGVRRIVINAAHLAPVLQAYLGDGSHWGVTIDWSVEATCAEQAYESGGGIRAALPYLTAEAFPVVACDIMSDYPYSRLIEKARTLCQHPWDADLVLVPNPLYHRKGDFSLSVHGIVSYDNPMYTFSSLGVYRRCIFRSESIHRFSLFPWLLQQQTDRVVHGELYQGRWCNVGDLQELARARKQFASSSLFSDLNSVQ